MGGAAIDISALEELREELDTLIATCKKVGEHFDDGLSTLNDEGYENKDIARVVNVMLGLEV